jgi:hypothetical protein
MNLRLQLIAAKNVGLTTIQAASSTQSRRVHRRRLVASSTLASLHHPSEKGRKRYNHHIRRRFSAHATSGSRRVLMKAPTLRTRTPTTANVTQRLQMNPNRSGRPVSAPSSEAMYPFRITPLSRKNTSMKIRSVCGLHRRRSFTQLSARI